MSDGLRIIIAHTPAERADAMALRIAVFVEEQQIPRDEELDEYDDTAVHCIGYIGDAPVATGRLLLFDGHAKVGRMAVLESHRGRGHGAAVLDALEREAAARGVRTIRLSAQLHAAPFYERAGYVRVGDVYDEVDIPHIAMEKTLGG